MTMTMTGRDENRDDPRTVDDGEVGQSSAPLFLNSDSQVAPSRNW